MVSLIGCGGYLADSGGCEGVILLWSVEPFGGICLGSLCSYSVFFCLVFHIFPINAMASVTSSIYHQTNLANHHNLRTDWSDYEDLITSIKRGFKHTANILLDKGCRVVRPGSLDSPLHLAVDRTGWSVVVKRLLDRGARVGIRDAKNDTALHHAFIREVPDTIINNMVLNYLKETNENLVNDDGLSFLHIACARSKLTFVREFLERVDVNVNGQMRMGVNSAYAGFSALHFAVEFGRLEVAACLLKANASIYIADANGTTPLHLACYRRNVNMIDLLLEYDRIYVNITDNLGTTHFMSACMSSNPDFAKRYLKVAYHCYNVSPVTLANEKLLDSPVFPFPGYTPLHFAAELGRLETVQMLLTYGAFCCAMTGSKATPFMLASRNSHTEVCVVLKEHCENAQMRVFVPSSQGRNEKEMKVESGSYQGDSSPDTAYGSAPQSCEQPETLIDLSPFRCDSQGYDMTLVYD